MSKGAEICANALVRLGQNPIQGFGDGTDIANSCQIIWDVKYKYILSMYPWRFSMNYAQLSRLITPPSQQWKYQFNLPSDRVQSGFPVVYTDASVGSSPLGGAFYRIIGNVIMSNQSALFVQYQYDVPGDLWPSYFDELMINVMKVDLCYLVTDNTTLHNEIKRETYGTPTEAGVGGLMGIAMFLDSRDNPTTYIENFTLVNARFAGTSY